MIMCPCFVFVFFLFLFLFLVFFSPPPSPPQSTRGGVAVKEVDIQIVTLLFKLSYAIIVITDYAVPYLYYDYLLTYYDTGTTNVIISSIG